MKLGRAMGVCHRGNVRSRNEDAVFVDGRCYRDEDVDDELSGGSFHAVLVADGMGGHEGGDYASMHALTLFGERFRDLAGQSIESIPFGVREILNEIHASLRGKGQSFRAPGTTLCGFLQTSASDLFLINVGDSRLYRVRGHEILQLSKDHTLRATSGLSNVPDNILVSCLGGGISGFHAQISQIGQQILPGDFLMVCSDGLYHATDVSALPELLLYESETARDRLLRLALEGRAEDNVSFVIVDVEEG